MDLAAGPLAEGRAQARCGSTGARHRAVGRVGTAAGAAGRGQDHGDPRDQPHALGRRAPPRGSGRHLKRGASPRHYATSFCPSLRPEPLAAALLPSASARPPCLRPWAAWAASLATPRALAPAALRHARCRWVATATFRTRAWGPHAVCRRARPAPGLLSMPPHAQLLRQVPCCCMHAARRPRKQPRLCWTP